MWCIEKHRRKNHKNITSGHPTHFFFCTFLPLVFAFIIEFNIRHIFKNYFQFFSITLHSYRGNEIIFAVRFQIINKKKHKYFKSNESWKMETRSCDIRSDKYF
jgi:hypothetical protein